jgi:hypothetical protein
MLVQNERSADGTTTRRLDAAGAAAVGGGFAVADVAHMGQIVGGMQVGSTTFVSVSTEKMTATLTPLPSLSQSFISFPFLPNTHSLCMSFSPYQVVAAAEYAKGEAHWRDAEAAAAAQRQALAEAARARSDAKRRAMDADAAAAAVLAQDDADSAQAEALAKSMEVGNDASV